jgi:pSer/pThr/pTyr-binding forkhead associated (FHA) protein
MEKENALYELQIEILSGPMDGMEFKIEKDVFTIGREKDKDVSIPLDILISRFHARITHENGRYWIEDMGSTNGTFIGTNTVKGKERLNINVIFKLGMTEMRLTKPCRLKRSGVDISIQRKA